MDPREVQQTKKRKGPEALTKTLKRRTGRGSPLGHYDGTVYVSGAGNATRDPRYEGGKRHSKLLGNRRIRVRR